MQSENANKMKPQNTSAKKCPTNANKSAKQTSKNASAKNMQTKLQKDSDKKMQFLELCILCIFGRASGLQKLKKNCKNSRENAKKCKRKDAKKCTFWNCAFFCIFWWPPVRAPKAQKIVSMSTKEKARKVEKKLWAENCTENVEQRMQKTTRRRTKANVSNSH